MTQDNPFLDYEMIFFLIKGQPLIPTPSFPGLFRNNLDLAHPLTIWDG